MAGDASEKGLLVDDLATMMSPAAEVLERAAADTGLVPISADFSIEGDDRYVTLATPAELAMADQRTAIDRIRTPWEYRAAPVRSSPVTTARARKATGRASRS